MPDFELPIEIPFGTAILSCYFHQFDNSQLDYGLNSITAALAAKWKTVYNWTLPGASWMVAGPGFGAPSTGAAAESPDVLIMDGDLGNGT